MLRLFSSLGILLALAFTAGAAHSAPAPTKYPVKIKIKIAGLESGDSFVIVPEKKYSLSLNAPESKRSKIALYDKKGNKREGLYWIQNSDLEKIMKKPIADVLRTLENRPTPGANPACADCLTDDAQNRPEPTPEPPAAPAPAPVADDDEAPTSEICGKFNAFLKKGVPEAPLKQALTYLQRNGKKIPKQRYLSIADYSKNSRNKRFYLLDLKTGEVTAEKVSHGSGKVGRNVVSDPNNDGNVDRCEHPNRVLAEKKTGRNLHTRENMTRPGFFRTGRLDLSVAHKRKWPRVTKNTNSMLLDGLSGRVNATAGDEGVKMHEAYYNHKGANMIMGKSFGCPAFQPGHGAPIMKKIEGGSLYYSYVPVCKGDTDYVLKDAPNWEKFCE